MTEDPAVAEARRVLTDRGAREMAIVRGVHIEVLEDLLASYDARLKEVSSPETADRVLGALELRPVSSIRDLGDELGIGRSTAQRAVQRLILDGRLRVVRMGTGDGYASRYEIVPVPREAR